MAIAMEHRYSERYGPRHGPPRDERWSADPYSKRQRPGYDSQMGFFAAAPPPVYTPYGGGFHDGRGPPPTSAGSHRGGKSRGKPWRGGGVAQGAYAGPQGQQGGVGKRRSKKHKGAGVPGRETPRSVPPAPYNSNLYLATTAHGSQTPSILGADYHIVTPNPHGTTWKNTAPTLDKDMLDRAKEAGLDMFSGNDDLMLAVGLQPRDFVDEEEDVLGWSEDDMGGTLTDPEASGTVAAQRLKRQLQGQAVYIAELEERNMNLEEKVWVLEQQLKSLKAQVMGEEDGNGQAAGAGSGEHDVDDARTHAGSSSGAEDVDGEDDVRHRRHRHGHSRHVDQDLVGRLARGDGGVLEGPAQGQGHAQEDEQLQGPGEAHGGLSGDGGEVAAGGEEHEPLRAHGRLHEDGEASSVSGQRAHGAADDGTVEQQQQAQQHSAGPEEGDPGDKGE